MVIHMLTHLQYAQKQLPTHGTARHNASMLAMVTIYPENMGKYNSYVPHIYLEQLGFSLHGPPCACFAFHLDTQYQRHFHHWPHSFLLPR